MYKIINIIVIESIIDGSSGEVSTSVIIASLAEGMERIEKTIINRIIFQYALKANSSQIILAIHESYYNFTDEGDF